MLGRQAHLLVDIIVGLSHLGHNVDTHDFMAKTQDSLLVAFAIARRHLAERSDKQHRVNQTLGSYPLFKPGQEVLLYKPHHGMDGPNPKLLCPWRGSLHDPGTAVADRSSTTILS